MPGLRITFCAVAAYVFAEQVLGHSGPLFAATSSIIALGFARDRGCAGLEVAIGCTLGITVGDLLLHFLGPGIWQAALVLLVSILLARFLDSGTIFTTQLGLQSVLVVLLPAPPGGPFTRSLDAVIGGTFALIVTMLIPAIRVRNHAARTETPGRTAASVLRDCSDALAKSDPTKAWHALIRARASQPLIDEVRGSFSSAREVARISLAYRRHREEVGDLQDSAEMADLAMRNSRVFARRLTSAINHAAISDEATENLSEVLQETADAVDSLARGPRGPRSRGAERRPTGDRTLGRDRHPAAPRGPGHRDHGRRGLVLLFRPLMVDLLEAAGLSQDDAGSYLPDSVVPGPG